MIQLDDETRLVGSPIDYRVDRIRARKSYPGKLLSSLSVRFAIKLVVNPLFMPIFFVYRNVPQTAVDILIVWSTIILWVIVVWLYFKCGRPYPRPILCLVVDGDRVTNEHH